MEQINFAEKGIFFSETFDKQWFCFHFLKISNECFSVINLD